MRLPAFACAFVVALASSALPAGAAPGYLRHPDLHGNMVVFVAESDLWMTTDKGGASRRLTTHDGSEYYPRFAPDGRSIAFTGEYDGNRDVYVISIAGGEPRRLTWHPNPDEVVGWTPDGSRILFRSDREEPHSNWELFSVAPAGGDPEKLPLGYAALIDMDRTSGQWAFTRSSYSENASWKRYRGGSAADIWVGHPARADWRQITTFPGPDGFPMWHAGRIYFLTDQGGTGNLWSMLPDGSDRKRHTDCGQWDARWPAMGPDGRIVFMLAGDVHLFDPAFGTDVKLEIDLPSERALTRVRYPNVQENLTYFDLAPDGDRVAVVTRGEIFVVPVEADGVGGVTLPISRGSGSREKFANFDATGKRLAYVSDVTGEERIYTIDAWGRDAPRPLTPEQENAGWHFPPVYSPDGKWVAYGDQTQTLYVMPVAGGTARRVDRSEQGEIRHYTWSPDGRWLAYAKLPRTEFSTLYIYDTRDGMTRAVSGPNTSDSEPVWDPEGRYLFFLSERTVDPVLGWGARDFSNVELATIKPYVMLLRKDVANPFAPLAGLPGAETEDEKKAKKKEEAEKHKKPGEDLEPVAIDFDGLASRVVAVPTDPGIYVGLTAAEDRIFYLSVPIAGIDALFAEDQPRNDLYSYDLVAKEEELFMEEVTTYALAPHSGKLAVMKKKGEIYVVDGAAAAPEGEDLEKAKLALDGIVLELDPRAEWEQMYHEAWRLERDFYWDPGMGGVDWPLVRDQYATLLPRLANRGDLRDLIAEMIGELSTSHTYVWGGDRGVSVPAVTTGLLGADVEREGDFFRVARLYGGDAADNVRSPLREPGVDVKEGDYILAVNRRPFPAGESFLASFAALAEKPVLLTVNSRPSHKNSRDVVVTPLKSEQPLRYADWVRRNREYVAEKTGGKIGYIHLPDMQQDGLTRFDTWFYPQLDKEGMIVDARWNQGGFVSQLVLERLRRKIVSFDRGRAGGVYSYPYRTLNGPFVVLTNEFAGSDGDIFPVCVQLEKLAPVIGTRSWGGVVGIRGDKPLVDGGMLTQPEFAWWDPKEGWALENRGAIPDIEIDNRPEQVAKGIDAQLDRGIQEVLRLHAERPPVQAEFGPVRPRNRAAYQNER